MLSEREKTVLILLTKGYTNKEIAAELCVTTHTAKAHVASILSKMKVKNRLQAAMAADKYL